MAKLYDENFSKSLMSFGKSFSRLNGQPLDDSSVYFSYEEAATYAASASAYVGQPIAVIDKVNSTAKLYLIENEAGRLQEIGANVEFEDTNTTYSLSLVRDEVNKGTKIIFASSDEDENNVEFFIPDAYDDSELVSRIDDLEEKASAKAEQSYVEEELNKKANADEVYSVEEINDLLDEKADKATTLEGYGITDAYTKTETDTEIGKAVAAADHLKRKIVDSKDDIDLTAADVMQYIYMVPSGLTASDNKYYEFIVLEEDGNKYIEQVGNWEVDLKDYLTTASAEETYAKKNDVANIYATKEDLKAYSTTEEVAAEYVSNSELETALAPYAKTTDIPTDYVTDSEFAEEIAKYETAKIAEEKYVAKEDGKSLIADTEIERLAKVNENAEVNYVKSVDENRFTVTEAGKLELNDLIDYVKVTDATAEDGLRFINQAEINKLSKLNLDGEDITISGSVNASQVKELYATVANIVKGSTADLDPDTEGSQLGLGIQEGAQVNFIDSVNTDVFSVDSTKKLDLVQVPVGKLDGLDSWVEENRDVVAGLFPTTAATLLNNLDNAINNEETGLIAELTAVKARVLTNENSIKDHADRLDAIEYAMTWHSLEQNNI